MFEGFNDPAFIKAILIIWGLWTVGMTAILIGLIRWAVGDFLDWRRRRGGKGSVGGWERVYENFSSSPKWRRREKRD